MQTAAFSVMTHGRGTLSFKWFVSSESVGDIGQVLLNGEEIAQKSGKTLRVNLLTIDGERVTLPATAASCPSALIGEGEIVADKQGSILILR